MTGPSPAGEHVQSQLGLYVLGGLSPEESLAVEQHLLRCPQCAAESDELSEVPPFLALLTAEEVEELASEFAPPQRADDATASAGHPDDRRRGSPRPTYRYRFVVAVIGVALVVGVGIGLWLRSTVPVGVTLAGSETNVVTGVTMSVTVVGHDERSHVDADVGGLRPGVEYELFAVDVRGQSRVVEHWIADGASYHFSGDLETRAEDLAFFTVTRTDGAVVVTVRVPASGRTAQSERRTVSDPAGWVDACGMLCRAVATGADWSA